MNSNDNGFSIVTDEKLSSDQHERLNQLFSEVSAEHGANIQSYKGIDGPDDHSLNDSDSLDESNISTESLNPGDLLSFDMGHIYSWILVVGGPLSAMQFLQSLTGTINNIKSIIKSEKITISYKGKKYDVKDGDDLDKIG